MFLRSSTGVFNLLALWALRATDPALAQPLSRVDVLKGEAARMINADLLARVESGFAGAVIVEQDGDIALQAGYGYANRERKRAFTSATIAQVGSITKQFTAMAVIDLWRQGRLEFSAPLSQYLPDLPTQAKALTIHQLLTHTAGLPAYCGDDFDPLTREQLFSQCLAAPLQHPPGTVYAYSNTGYSVLGALVEVLSDMTLEDFLQRRFFAPLQMKRTGYLFPELAADQFAVGYLGGKPQGIMSDRIRALDGAYWNLKGNGGIQASITDVHRWYQALSQGPVITDAMRDVALTPYVPAESGAGCGYGWFIRTAPDGRIAQVSHAGSDGVFWAGFIWRPEDRLFVYLVTNSDVEQGKAVTREILFAFRQ